jgi:hypothetical protein
MVPAEGAHSSRREIARFPGNYTQRVRALYMMPVGA